MLAKDSICSSFFLFLVLVIYSTQEKMAMRVKILLHLFQPKIRLQQIK